jgi:hypothetical protein
MTECTIKSACVVYNYIGKTQETEVKRREEEILEQAQQNTSITASAERAGRPSTKALQVRGKLKRLLCINSWEMKGSSNVCVTLDIWKGNVLYPLCT